MRKYFKIFAVLLVLVLPAAAFAEPLGPHGYIASAIDSVCKIEIYKDDMPIGSGSGFVVETDDEVTKIITARHVVEDVSKLCIILHGVAYFTQEYFEVDSTDAAMVFVKPGIKFAKALEFNLESKTNITAANALGFWGRARIPGTPQMLTMTSGWVDRRVVDKLGAPDYQIIRGLIYSNVLLFPGYSGGPLLDNEMRVLGINIILSTKHTIFVDSRYLWNSIANLNKGDKVLVPYCYDYDVLNTGTHKRILAVDTDYLLNGEDKTSLQDLGTIILADISANGKPTLPTPFQSQPSDAVCDLFSANTVLFIGDKKYLISSVAIMSRGLRSWAYETPYETNHKYIYVANDGYEVIFELADYAETPEIVIKSGAFFRHLQGKHIR